MLTDYITCFKISTNQLPDELLSLILLKTEIIKTNCEFNFTTKEFNRTASGSYFKTENEVLKMTAMKLSQSLRNISKRTSFRTNYIDHFFGLQDDALNRFARLSDATTATIIFDEVQQKLRFYYKDTARTIPGNPISFLAFCSTKIYVTSFVVEEFLNPETVSTVNGWSGSDEESYFSSSDAEKTLVQERKYSLKFLEKSKNRRLSRNGNEADQSQPTENIDNKELQLTCLQNLLIDLNIDLPTETDSMLGGKFKNDFKNYLEDKNITHLTDCSIYVFLGNSTKKGHVSNQKFENSFPMRLGLFVSSYYKRNFFSSFFPFEENDIYSDYNSDEFNFDDLNKNYEKISESMTVCDNFLKSIKKISKATSKDLIENEDLTNDIRFHCTQVLEYSEELSEQAKNRIIGSITKLMDTDGEPLPEEISNSLVEVFYYLVPDKDVKELENNDDMIEDKKEEGMKDESSSKDSLEDNKLADNVKINVSNKFFSFCPRKNVEDRHLGTCVCDMKTTRSCFEKFINELLKLKNKNLHFNNDNCLHKFVELSTEDLKTVSELVYECEKPIFVGKIGNEMHISFEFFERCSVVNNKNLILYYKRTLFNSMTWLSNFTNSLFQDSTISEKINHLLELDLMVDSEKHLRSLEIIHDQLSRQKLSSEMILNDLLIEEIRRLLNESINASSKEIAVGIWKNKTTRRLTNLSRNDADLNIDSIRTVIDNQAILDPVESMSFLTSLSNLHSEGVDRIPLRMTAQFDSSDNLSDEAVLAILENLDYVSDNIPANTLYLLDTNIYIRLFERSIPPTTFRATIFVPRVIVNEIRHISDTRMPGLFPFFIETLRYNKIVVNFSESDSQARGDEEIIKYDKQAVLVSTDKNLQDNWDGLMMRKNPVDDFYKLKEPIKKLSSAGEIIGDVYFKNNTIFCEKLSKLQSYLSVNVMLESDPLMPELPVHTDITSNEYKFVDQEEPVYDKSDLENFSIDKIVDLSERDLSRLMSEFELVEGFKVRTKNQFINMKRESLRENFQKADNRNVLRENRGFVEINRFNELSEPDYELGPFSSIDNGKPNLNSHLFTFKDNDGQSIFKKKSPKTNFDKIKNEEQKLKILARNKKFVSIEGLENKLEDNHTNVFKSCYSESNEKLEPVFSNLYNVEKFDQTAVGNDLESEEISKHIVNYEIQKSKDLEDFSKLHGHMIHDFVNQNVPKDFIYVNHNNFFRFGYLMYRSQTSRTQEKRRLIRYFFIGENKPEGFNEDKLGTCSVTGKKIFISRVYSLSLSDVIYRSRLYGSLFSISRFKEVNMTLLYWTLFFRSKIVSGLLAFNKFYNTISNTTYAKLSNLTKKYLSCLPKRRTEEWLLDRILTMIEENSKGNAHTIFGPAKNQHDYMELGNLYTFTPTDITTSHSSYNNFYEDIINNLKTAPKQFKDDIFDEQFSSTKKTVSKGAIEYGLNKIKENYPFPEEHEMIEDMNKEFDGYFNKTTKTTDPKDFKKKAGSVVHLSTMKAFLEDKNKEMNSTSDQAKKGFEPLEYIEWNLRKTEERGAMILMGRKPQNDFADREIAIQEMHTKASHFAIQTIMKTVCDKIPTELVTKSQFTKLERISGMEFENSIYSNIDMAKWSPHDAKIKFKVVIEKLYHTNLISKNIYNILIRSYNAVEEVFIMFDTRIGNRPGTKWYLTEDISEKGIKNSKPITVNDLNFHKFKGKILCPVLMTIGWPQGLMHNISTFVHVICGEVIKPVLYKSIGNDILVLILVHSDDGNMSLSSKREIPERSKLMLISTGNVVSLQFSLAYSQTKLSISLRPSHMRYTEEPPNEDIHSELVSIYNKSGKITDSWVRQSSEIMSSCTYKSFSQNYLALLTRCVTIHSLSGQVLWPEILFRYYSNQLKEYFFHEIKDVYDKTIQWCGDKNVSLRNISKFGFWGDNLIRFVNDPVFTSYQVKNPVSEVQKKTDVKNLRKFQFQNRLDVLKGLFKNKDRYDLPLLIDEESKRISSVKSGVFLISQDQDFFNYYKHSNSKNLTIFEERRNHSIKLKKFLLEVESNPNTEMKKPELVLYTSKQIRDQKKEKFIFEDESYLDEFIVGSESILNELKEDFEIHGDSTLRNNLSIGGSIWKNTFSTPFAISSDFSEAVSLVSNPKLFRTSIITKFKYNQVADDVKMFCLLAGITTVSEFTNSSGMWDYLKLLGKNRSNLKMNTFTDGRYGDVTFEKTNDQNVGMFLIRELSFKQTIRITRSKFSKRSKEFWNTIEERVQKSLINCYVTGKPFKISINYLEEAFRKFTNQEIQSQLKKPASNYMKILVHFIARKPIESIGKSNNLLYQSEDEDYGVYHFADEKTNQLYVVRGEETIVSSKCSNSLKNYIRRNLKTKIVINDEVIEEEEKQYKSILQTIPGIITSCEIRRSELVDGILKKSPFVLISTLIDHRQVTHTIESPINVRANSKMKNEMKSIFLNLFRQGSFIEVIDNREKLFMRRELEDYGILPEECSSLLDEIFPSIEYEKFSNIDININRNLKKDDIYKISQEVFRITKAPINYCKNHEKGICTDSKNSTSNPMFCLTKNGSNNVLTALLKRRIINEYESKTKPEEITNDLKSVIDMLNDKLIGDFSYFNNHSYIKSRIFYENLTNVVEGKPSNFDKMTVSLSKPEATQFMPLSSKITDEGYIFDIDTNSFLTNSGYQRCERIERRIKKVMLQKVFSSFFNDLKKRSPDLFKEGDLIKSSRRTVISKIMSGIELEDVDIKRMGLSDKSLTAIRKEIKVRTEHEDFKLQQLEKSLEESQEESYERLIRERKLNYYVISKYALKSKSFVSSSLTLKCNDLITRKSDMDCLVLKDKLCDYALILVGNEQKDTRLIQEEIFSKSTLINFSAFGLDISSFFDFDPKETVEFAKRMRNKQTNEVDELFLSEDLINIVENPETLQVVDESDEEDDEPEADRLMNLEMGGEVEITPEEIAESKTLVNCTLTANSDFLDKVWKLTGTTDFGLFDSVSLRKSINNVLDQGINNPEQTRSYNEIKKLEGTKKSLEILKLAIPFFEENFDNSISKRLISSDTLIVDEKGKKSVMPRFGTVFATGFKNSSVEKVIRVMKSCSLKINSTDPRSLRSFNNLRCSLGSVTKERFDDFNDESQRILVELRSSVSLLINVLELNLQDVEIKGSQRAISKALSELNSPIKI